MCRHKQEREARVRRTRVGGGTVRVEEVRIGLKELGLEEIGVGTS